MHSRFKIALLILNQVTRNPPQKIRTITNQLRLHGLFEFIGYGANEAGVFTAKLFNDQVHKLIQCVGHVGNDHGLGVAVVVLHGHP